MLVPLPSEPIVTSMWRLPNKMGAWVRVARVAKTRNLEGNLVVQAIAGLPFLLSEGMEVRFVPPTLKGPRSAVVRELFQSKGNACEVSFDGVESASDADLLIGSYCLVRRDSLPEIDYASTPSALAGWRVCDAEFGDLGEIAEVIDNPGQSLLVVRGERGEVLIPVVDEFIRSIQEDERVVGTAIPAGLLTLSESSDEDLPEDES